MKSPTLKVVVAGEPLLSQHVVLLAKMLGDHPLADRLERGLAQRNSIVSLTTEDREHLIELLGTPPSGLAALHSALLRQRVRLRRRALTAENASIRAEEDWPEPIEELESPLPFVD